MTIKAGESANRTPVLMAWSCVVLFTGLTMTGLILQIVSGRSEGDYGYGESFILAFCLGGMLLIGALIISRRSGHRMGWILCAFPLLWAFLQFSYGYAVYTLLHNPGVLPAGLPMAMLYRGTFFLATLPFILIFLLFPDGHPLTPSWRIVGWIGVVTSTILFLGGLLEIDLLADGLVINPNNVESFLPLIEPLLIIAFVLNFLALVAAAISLILRLFRAQGEQKQQIKWFVYATLFLPIGFGLLFFGPSNITEIIGMIFAAAAVFGMGIAVGISIFRYRLWDIDIIIRKTLVYGAITLLLALVYFGSVVLLQQAFRALTGQDSPVAIVISTLVIAALFNPLRGRVQGAIDRRFYRSKFDAQQTLAAFAATARDEVELDQLSEELLSVVQETM